MKYIILFIISLFTSFNVYAVECDSKTKSNLLKEANQIKVDYEEKSETVHVNAYGDEFDMEKYWLEVSLYNLTNNFTLQISNDYNDDKITVISSMIKDGKYTFKDLNYNSIIKYKIELFTNSDSCDRYIVKTINYTKPMLNPNYAYESCQNNDGLSICKKYITNSNYIYNMGLGLDEAINDIKKNGDKNSEEPQENNKNFWQKYYIYIIASTSVLLIITVTLIIINKKRSEI